jgi:hypothetical protein
MKRWHRFDARGSRHAHMRCGNCPRPIYHGQPYLTLEAPAWKTPKIRCEQCAGEPPQFEPSQAVSDANKEKRIEASAAAAMQHLTGAFQLTLGMDR